MAGRRLDPWSIGLTATIYLTACGSRTSLELLIDGSSTDVGTDGDDGLGASGNAGGSGGRSSGGQNAGGQDTGGRASGGQNAGGGTGGQGTGGASPCSYGYVDEGSGCQPILVGLWPTAGGLNPPVSSLGREYSVTVPLWTEGLLLAPSVAPGADVLFNGQLLAGNYGLRPPALTPGIQLTEPLEVFQDGYPSTFYQIHLLREGRVDYIKATNTDAEAGFGSIVALSGDGRTLAVGAPDEASSATGINGDQSDTSAPGSGAVYVYVRDGLSWSLQAYLKASNAQAFDEFGISLALSGDGNVLVVGALVEDSSATGVDGNAFDNSASSAGAAYVFVRSGSSWQEEAYLKASNTDPGDYFGRTVAISADASTLAISATEEDSSATGIDGNESLDNALQSGAVYLFSRAGGAITQEAYLKASNTDAFDAFGIALGLSADGGLLAVGADGEDSASTGMGGDQLDDSGPNTGAVYVFSRVGSNWTEDAYIKASNTRDDDAFGAALALSADASTLAVGAYGEGGWSSGINGDEYNYGFGVGAVYVLSRNGTSWTQEAYVKASIPQNAGFGWSTALSENGNILVVGAPWEDSSSTGIDGDQYDYVYGSGSQSGAAYRFIRTDYGWSQVGYIKATNTGAGDSFGFRVATSGNGTVIGVSALYEDSAATGVNGDPESEDVYDSGAVYVLSEE